MSNLYGRHERILLPFFCFWYSTGIIHSSFLVACIYRRDLYLSLTHSLTHSFATPQYHGNERWPLDLRSAQREKLVHPPDIPLQWRVRESTLCGGDRTRTFEVNLFNNNTIFSFSSFRRFFASTSSLTPLFSFFFSFFFCLSEFAMRNWVALISQLHALFPSTCYSDPSVTVWYVLPLLLRLSVFF